MDIPRMPGSVDPEAMRGMVQLTTSLSSLVRKTVLENGGRGINAEKRESLVEAITTEVLTFMMTDVPMLFGGGQGEGKA